MSQDGWMMVLGILKEILNQGSPMRVLSIEGDPFDPAGFKYMVLIGFMLGLPSGHLVATGKDSHAVYLSMSDILGNIPNEEHGTIYQVLDLYKQYEPVKVPKEVVQASRMKPREETNPHHNAHHDMGRVES